MFTRGRAPGTNEAYPPPSAFSNPPAIQVQTVLFSPPETPSWEAMTRFPWKGKHYRKLRKEARIALREADAGDVYHRLLALTAFINGSMVYVKEKKDDQGPGSLMRAAKSREGVCFHFSGLLCMLLNDERIKAALMWGMVALDTTDMYRHCSKPMEERARSEKTHAWVKAQASGMMLLADPVNGAVYNYLAAPAKGYTSERMYMDAEREDRRAPLTDLAPLLRC